MSHLAGLLPVALVLAGCKIEVQLPEGALEDIARDTCLVGHPTATYEGARIVDFSTGWFGSDQSVDIAIDYKGVMARKTKTMTVRFHVNSLDPCEVRTEVVSDTGTNAPILLDNNIASPIIGQKVCDAFE